MNICQEIKEHHLIEETADPEKIHISKNELTTLSITDSSKGSTSFLLDRRDSIVEEQRKTNPLDSAATKTKLNRRKERYMSVARQNNLLKKHHGKVRFKKLKCGRAPNLKYKAKAILNDTSYTADGKTFRAARQRCVLAILKSCNGIDAQFTPVFRLKEILGAKLDWRYTHRRVKREGSKPWIQARLWLNERYYRAYGRTNIQARKQCSIKILRDAYGIDDN